MKIVMERTDNGHEFARVIKLLKEKDGRPIRIASDNPILDICMYEVEYANRYKSAMASKMTENSIFAQVDQDGQRFVLFDEIIDARTDGTQTKIPDDLIHMKNEKKSRRETAEGWDICIQ